MKFSEKLKKKDEEKYIEICTQLWGCVPVDITWAINTKPYIEYLKKSE